MNSNRQVPNLYFNISTNGLQLSQFPALNTQIDCSFDANADLTFLRLEAVNVPTNSILTSVVYDAKIYEQEQELEDFVAEKLSNTQMDAEVSFMSADTLHKVDTQDTNTILRPQSPFPSPKLRRKVQNIIESRHIRLEKTQSDSKVGKRPIPSPLSISAPSDSSFDILESREPRKKLDITSAKFRNFNEIIGPFIGNYEESLLNGRLSTSPSKSLLFFSEIGAFGTGKCKPSLKCPRHLVVPFNVVFYHLSDVEIPTPYVGLVEFPESSAEVQLEHGCYRLPLKGQLQIVIFFNSLLKIKQVP